MWLACHGWLVTKHQLYNFGMVESHRCCFCTNEETINHLIYGCHKLKTIWSKELNWIYVKRTPLYWDEELAWLIRNTKGKCLKTSILKLVATKTLYGVWKYRNNKSYDNSVDNTKIVENILDMIVYRGGIVGHLELILLSWWCSSFHFLVCLSFLRVGSMWLPCTFVSFELIQVFVD